MPKSWHEMNRPTRRAEGTLDDMKVIDLQEKVGSGEYQVDTRAVAEAIVRRILGDRGPRTTPQNSSTA
jgi:anti-sigma28 factor (negative regulator of flagellin synthesis)